MGFITADEIRELASFDAGDSLVTTCYLEVEGKRLIRAKDCEVVLDGVLRGAAARANGATAKDVERIEEHVRGGFDRSRVQGLAFFSCEAAGLWQVVPLPVPVTSRVIVSSAPAVGPLESILQEARRIGILLVDKQHAKLWVFELGELVDRSEVFDELPRDYDSRGEKERGDTSHHVEALAAQHLRHAAAVAFDVLKEQHYDCIYLGAPDAIAHDLEQAFHPYVKERLSGRVTLGVSAGSEEIRTVALELEAEARRRRENDLVERLRTAVATGGRAVAGLGPVLGAEAEHRIERLLVSSGYQEAGWSCPACGTRAVVGRACPSCGAEMDRLDDAVEDVVDRLLIAGTPVDICVDNADLDVLGRIGALLRY